MKGHEYRHMRTMFSFVPYIDLIGILVPITEAEKVWGDLKK